MEVTVSYFETDDTTSVLGLYKNITATVDAVDPITHTLRLYTGVVNEFGKELPVVISFEEILEVCILQISTTRPKQRS